MNVENTVIDLDPTGKIADLTFTALSNLKVQSCKLYNNKYMIASTQITNTEVFALVSVLVSKLLSRKVLLTNRKRQ